MASSSSNAVARTLFKSLLRSARKLDRALPLASVPSELKAMGATVPSSSFAEAVKAGFRANRSVQSGSQEQRALVDGAFSFLQAANKRLAASSAPAAASAPAAPAVVPSKPSSVVYSVGQVFRHRTYGYRAVIIGWDQACKASPEWVASTGTARLPHGTSQPFYHCLVDVRDRPEAQVSYVAQDNIDMLFGAEDSCLVMHPLAAKYFSAYSPSKGCFSPNEALQGEYPADDAATVPVQALQAKAKAKQSIPASRAHVLSPATAMLAPSAVRGVGISDGDLILKAALRNAAAIKAQREARQQLAAAAASAASVSSAASASSSSSSSSDSEGEVTEMA